MAFLSVRRSSPANPAMSRVVLRGYQTLNPVCAASLRGGFGIGETLHQVDEEIPLRIVLDVGHVGDCHRTFRLARDEKLPDAIAETIRKAVGDDRQLLDALLIVGALQALQGDEKWAKLRGYGKVPDKIIGDADNPVAHTFTLKIDNQ
jgi:hypothetical protein